MSIRNQSRSRFTAHSWLGGIAVFVSIAPTLAFAAQSFTSGSTGADGALTYTTPGTYTFDPSKLTPPLNASGTNIFNFTTITIGSGVTLRLTSKVLTGPVIWLASGDVTINGTIDLSGEDANGALSTNQSSERVTAAAGAGGYNGGLGGMSGGSPAQNGSGPGGGTGSTSTSTRGGDGTFTGNQFLTPLFGGSGGGGGFAASGTFGGEGGGGGGALLIASTSSIHLNGGVIDADGGMCGGGGNCVNNPTNGAYGGGGAGGAVRLVAPTIDASGGAVYARFAKGVSGNNNTPNDGKIRIEAATLGQGDFRGNPTFGAPIPLILPTTPPPSIRVTKINGVVINANQFGFDATINSTSPITVNIEAHYVPVGTVPKVIVFSETGPDQVITASALSGNLSLSTATASITFPTGGSRGYVKATW